MYFFNRELRYVGKAREERARRTATTAEVHPFEVLYSKDPKVALQTQYIAIDFIFPYDALHSVVIALFEKGYEK